VTNLSQKQTIRRAQHSALITIVLSIQNADSVDRTGQKISNRGKNLKPPERQPATRLK
jgi:hypothetical protein